MNDDPIYLDDGARPGDGRFVAIYAALVVLGLTLIFLGASAMEYAP